jgi:hypothetical protein
MRKGGGRAGRHWIPERPGQTKKWRQKLWETDQINPASDSEFVTAVAMIAPTAAEMRIALTGLSCAYVTTIADICDGRAHFFRRIIERIHGLIGGRPRLVCSLCKRGPGVASNAINPLGQFVDASVGEVLGGANPALNLFRGLIGQILALLAKLFDTLSTSLTPTRRPVIQRVIRRILSR